MSQSERNLSRKDLEFLLTLWNTRSLSETANELRFSVAKGSRILADLRHEFHDELFVRIGLRMEPTKFMSGRIDQYRETLTMIDSLYETRCFNPATLTTKFSIISIDMPVVLYGANIYNTIKRQAPNATVEFKGVTDDFYKMLESGQADVGLSPRTDLPDTFHASKILVRNQCLILRKGHPLLERAEKTGEPITEAALKAYPRCVLVKPNARIYETQGETICIPNLLLAAPFLRSCDAYAIVGELAYHSYFKQFGITAVNLPEITEETRGLVNQVQMIWHHRYHNSPSHQWLRAVIHSAVREEAEKMECCP